MCVRLSTAERQGVEKRQIVDRKTSQGGNSDASHCIRDANLVKGAWEAKHGLIIEWCEVGKVECSRNIGRGESAEFLSEKIGVFMRENRIQPSQASKFKPKTKHSLKLIQSQTTKSRSGARTHTRTRLYLRCPHTTRRLGL